MTTPTSEQISDQIITHRQFLSAAKFIAEEHKATVRFGAGDGAIEIQLPGSENPHLIVVVVHAQANGRVSMDVQRIDDNDSQTPTVLTIIGADGELNRYWTAGLRQIIVNNGGEPR